MRNTLYAMLLFFVVLNIVPLHASKEFGEEDGTTSSFLPRTLASDNVRSVRDIEAIHPDDRSAFGAEKEKKRNERFLKESGLDNGETEVKAFPNGN